MTQYKALFISTTSEINDSLKERVQVEGVNILAATTLEEVQSVFEEEAVDIVLLGTPRELLENRLQIIKFIADNDEYPSIHIRGGVND